MSCRLISAVPVIARLLIITCYVCSRDRDPLKPRGHDRFTSLVPFAPARSELISRGGIRRWPGRPFPNLIQCDPETNGEHFNSKEFSHVSNHRSGLVCVRHRILSCV